MTSNDDVLNSWKEVANYLGRGVRTVQRWEQELNLPVRRPRGRSRSAVIAFKTELDAWLHQPQAGLPAADLNALLPAAKSISLNGSNSRRTELHERTAALVKKMELLLSNSTGLCERSRILSQRLNHTVELAVSNMERSTRKNGGGEKRRFQPAYSEREPSHSSRIQ